MNENATWYGSRPRPRPDCVRQGPSSPAKWTGQLPLFSARVYCGHGRRSQLLLSSCTNYMAVVIVTSSELSMYAAFVNVGFYPVGRSDRLYERSLYLVPNVRQLGQLIDPVPRLTSGME